MWRSVISCCAPRIRLLRFSSSSPLAAGSRCITRIASSGPMRLRQKKHDAHHDLRGGLRLWPPQQEWHGFPEDNGREVLIEVDAVGQKWRENGLICLTKFSQKTNSRAHANNVQNIPTIVCSHCGVIIQCPCSALDGLGIRGGCRQRRRHNRQAQPRRLRGSRVSNHEI